ncbi:MAG: DUF3565 domain-containing protein [Granulosicoccus sp.]|nr:DUF3565 domain-containing protein [Granulosicoccus sp.]
MLQKITGFHKDELDDWVAELDCRHTQHVRHRPPWINRAWVESLQGRLSRLGEPLDCLKCDRNEPPDLR